MSEFDSELPEVYLRPGEVHLSREPAILKTLLGSCVGVTFWCQRLGIGALCHAMLPRLPERATAGLALAQRWRYVDFCIRDLARQFDVLGASRSEIEIKMFGGADVLPVYATDSSRATVGRLNCQAALDVLRAEGLKLVASDLGGINGRTIQFHTATGEVLLRRLARPVFDDEVIDADGTLARSAGDL